MIRCRLLIDPPAAGSWNMAVDEALQLGAKPESPLTLRFYGWSPATLSLGYFQSLAQRTTHAASATCPATRRLSGGGAILHDCELTYSVVVPPGHSESRNIQSLYDLFHQSLIETLEDWGVRAAQCVKPVALPPAEEPFLCFARRAHGDVLLAGAKVCGSAQRRRNGAVLQHGSVLLAQSAFAPELAGVAELSGVGIAPAELIAAWTARLQQRLCLVFEPDVLSIEERAEADRFAHEKYAGPSWIARR